MRKIESKDIEKVLGLNIKKNENIAEIEENFKFLNGKFSILYDFILTYNNFVNKKKTYDSQGDELTMLEAHVLLDIVEYPKITVSELANKWKKTPSAISQTLKKLIAKDYVYREISSVNAKFFLLFPTEKGKKFTIYHKHYDNIDIVKTIKRLRKDFTVEEIAIFYKVMEGFTKIVECSEE